METKHDPWAETMPDLAEPGMTTSDLAAVIARSMVDKMAALPRPYTYADAADIAEKVLACTDGTPKQRAQCKRHVLTLLLFYRLGRKSAGLHDMEG